MRVLMAQVSPVVGDVAGNEALARAALVSGRAQGADLVVLTEMLLSGYPPRDLLDYDGFLEACEQAAGRLAEATDAAGPVLVFGSPWRSPGGLRNAAVVAHGGRIVALRFKSLLPTYDVFDESRYFVPEDATTPVQVAGFTLGITVCEDLWNDTELFPRHRYATDPLVRLAGCDAIINLSASPFHAGKAGLRRELFRRRARQAQAPVIFVNQVGGNDELLFDGRSMAFSAAGELLAHGRAFAPDEVLHDTAAVAAAEPPRIAFEEEVTAALTMGIRDYAARCGFKSAVLGLSGGIDSAVVCCLAARALGPERVTAVGMPGPYSSGASLADARILAANLGVHFEVLPIGPVYEAYRAVLAARFVGRPFDVTEENLQARTRGNLLMALSNKEGHLVLTTGNKSETAVGYTTLYGDMAGGLAVISDVFKTDVYRLARHFNRDHEIIPEYILTRPPSAELAPDQTDEASLMPYAELDAILHLYLEERWDPSAIEAQGFDPAHVRRAVRLVIRSEYKRWQAPPGLRVTVRAFGTGRRHPLAQRWKG
ncbi:MAG: NAD+ synthase [Pseudomonadota bacterium]